MRPIYYTVFLHTSGYPVHWLDPDTCEERIFTIPQYTFKDPAGACGEFEACVVGRRESHFLDMTTFRAKVDEIKKERQRLAEWNAAAKSV